MRFFTHLVAGILAAVLFIDLFNPRNLILSAIVIILASVLPDIDTPMSKVGKRFKVVGFIFKHRGFFHSLLAILIFGFLLMSVYGKEIALAFSIGYLAHLLMDALTVSGVRFFHPFSKKTIKGFVKTGGFLEKIVTASLIVVVIIKKMLECMEGFLVA